MEALRTLVALIAMFSASVACAQPAPAISDLTKDKVRFPSGDSFSLALPTLSVGQSDKQRMDQLTALSGGAGWKRFSRDSTVAPVAIDVKYLNGADGSRVGHSLHAAFVVHASLETLKDKDLMQQLFANESSSGKTESKSEGQVSDKVLIERGITKTENTSFANAEIALLKKVTVRGVLQVQKSESENGIDFAFRLDKRFNDADQTSNAWSRIGKDKATLPDWTPYSGAAGYLVVRRLPELESACLIECRVLLHEPKEWFNGSNLLRSKLPLMIQETARSFRRQFKL